MRHSSGITWWALSPMTRVLGRVRQRKVWRRVKDEVMWPWRHDVTAPWNAYRQQEQDDTRKEFYPGVSEGTWPATPSFRTSGLQNPERIKSHCFQLPSWGSLATAALGNYHNQGVCLNMRGREGLSCLRSRKRVFERPSDLLKVSCTAAKNYNQPSLMYFPLSVILTVTSENKGKWTLRRILKLQDKMKKRQWVEGGFSRPRHPYQRQGEN